jgi:hypothetical protein
MNATATKTAEVATVLCFCGCETPVLSKKSKFAPGHDARYVGIQARALFTDPEAVAAKAKEIHEGLSPALAAKFTKMALNLNAKANKKESKKAARLATRKESATKGLQGAAVTVKVGRWMKAGIIEVVAGGKPAVIAYADSKGKTVRVNVTTKTEWSLA